MRLTDIGVDDKAVLYIKTNIAFLFLIFSAAVSFMVADMFDRSIDAGAITKAAR